MSSEISLQYSSKPFKSTPLDVNMINHHLVSVKTNPHKITKQSYGNSALSKKASINKKRKLTKREKEKCSSLVLKNFSLYGLEDCKLDTSMQNANILQQIQDYQSLLDSQGKENFFSANLTPAQNYKDGFNLSIHLKSAPLRNSPVEQTSTPPSEQQQKEEKFNQFSTYNTIQGRDNCQNLIGEENKESRKCPITPQNRITTHSTQENDFSDRDTMEESVSCVSDNLGSQAKFSKASMRVSDTETKENFWNSQENSCCTVLDCDEAFGYNSSALLQEKKEYSVQDISEFEHDFGLFSSSDQQNEEASTASTENKQEKIKSIEDELAEFCPEMNPCAFDSDTINYLMLREADYLPDSLYLEKNQNQVNWSMRAILFDWMMEVCMEFGLKRETYHYSINYVDRYMSTVKSVQKSELQLIGVTALYMAAKVEEIYPPRVSSFAKSTAGAYSSAQITSLEFKMLKSLKWLLTPPTLNTWANWYMNQWDLYIEHSEYAKNHSLIKANKIELMQFKQSNQKSYAKFRELMQLIDCTVLDIQTLQYKPRVLIASMMYILLGKYFKNFTSNQIFEQFPRNSFYLLDKTSEFNDLFGNFLLYSFGFELNDLLPSIQYTSTYVRLPISLDLPKAVKMTKENVLEGHFEEFLAYQTHNEYNIQYIKRRPRNNFQI